MGAHLPACLPTCQVHLPPGGARRTGLSSVAAQAQGLGQPPRRLLVVLDRDGLVHVRGLCPARDGGGPRESKDRKKTLVSALRCSRAEREAPSPRGSPNFLPCLI